jgi:hypothetical protein
MDVSGGIRVVGVGYRGSEHPAVLNGLPEVREAALHPRLPARSDYRQVVAEAGAFTGAHDPVRSRAVTS